MKTAARHLTLCLALALLAGCVYRPYPRPLPPEAPGFVAPEYRPGTPAKPVR